MFELESKPPRYRVAVYIPEKRLDDDRVEHILAAELRFADRIIKFAGIGYQPDLVRCANAAE